MRLLLFLWEFPQNLLALILMLYYRIFCGKLTIKEYKGITYVGVPNRRFGVSLGAFVLLGTAYLDRDTTIKHEYGHTIQSLWFGPLYLILIGIPSGLGNLYDRFFHTKEKGWTVKDSIKWYYNQPWEKWADKLGGVER